MILINNKTLPPQEGLNALRNMKDSLSERTKPRAPKEDAKDKTVEKKKEQEDNNG